jgi:hypothetical protein
VNRRQLALPVRREFRQRDALLASEQRAWMHRMSVALLSGADNWEILLAQVTPVQFS